MPEIRDFDETQKEASKKDIQKDLIKIDTDIPSFKNNEKTISALREFVSNQSLNQVCLNCEKPLLLKAFYEFVRKSAKFAFTQIDALKITSIEDSLRKAIVLCIKSSRDVYEGEIVSIRQVKDENDVLQYIDMSLRSLKATKNIVLNKNLINLVNDVNIGDVVYIEPNSGILKRIGRSETRINEFDLEGDKHVPLMKGSVHSAREKDIYITLYDMDYAFNKYNDGITDFTRRHVDNTVLDYLTRGIAKLVCSGVCIVNSSALGKDSLYKIVNISSVYPHLKILVSNVNPKNWVQSFLFINSVSDEKPSDILEYFAKKTMAEDLKSAIDSVATYDNHEAVLAALRISDSVSEFIEFFNQ